MSAINFLLWRLIAGLALIVLLGGCSTSEPESASYPITVPEARPVDDTVHPFPTYQCDALVAQSAEKDREIKFRVEYSMYEAAEIDSMSFDFGDGSDPFSVADGYHAVLYRYEPGSYSANVTITFIVEDNSKPFEVKSTCSTVVTVE